MPVRGYSYYLTLSALAHETFSRAVELAVDLALEVGSVPDEDARVASLRQAAHNLHEKGAALRDAHQSLVRHVFVDGVRGANAESVLIRSRRLRECQQDLLRAMSQATSAIDELAAKAISCDKAARTTNSAQLVRTISTSMLDATDVSALVDHQQLARASRG